MAGASTVSGGCWRTRAPAPCRAARWAPSSYNEQPWHYVVATRDDRAQFERLLSCLVEGNQVRRDRRFTWAYLFGAICPARGTGAALVMPTVNIEAMNEHLAEISQCVSVSAIALLILDGAGWHGSPRLVVPDNIVLLPLPPYAPELNSVETIWEYLRSNWLSHRVWDTYEAILDACCEAWNALMAKSEVITSIGTRDWAQVRI
jgi:nitroreductase